MNFLNPIMYQLYNIFLTITPILWFGLFDRYKDHLFFYRHHRLYKSYHSGGPNEFTFKKYLVFNGKALLSSFVIFFFT